MNDETFGELFWSNVDKLLKENKKGTERYFKISRKQSQKRLKTCITDYIAVVQKVQIQIMSWETEYSSTVYSLMNY